jgi:hypothetical protein
MASDYGDEAGEKLFDWLARIGQDAGAHAMDNAAARFSNALHNARTGRADAAETVATEVGPEWGKLDMAEFKEIEGYPELKETIASKLDDAKVEHTFFEDAGTHREYLLFRLEDAPRLADTFDELITQVDSTRTQVRESLEAVRGRSREAARDTRPLDERAARARKASAALEGEKVASRTREREPRFQENRSK